MTPRLLPPLVLAATLAVAAPALAQDATSAPAPSAQSAPSPTPVPVEGEMAVQSPGEAALEAKGEAFGERMEAMAGEMKAAYDAAAGDQAKAEADLGPIADRYRPEAEAFATEVRDFILTQAGGVPSDQRSQVTEGAEQAYQTIRTIPDMIKQKILSGESLEGEREPE